MKERERRGEALGLLVGLVLSEWAFYFWLKGADLTGGEGVVGMVAVGLLGGMAGMGVFKGVVGGRIEGE